MSAPALRRPARGVDVARASLAASAPAALLGLAAVVAFTWPGTTNLPAAEDAPFVEVQGARTLLFFLPLLHWRGRGGSRALDQGLPMDDARQEWIRAACGALWAALTLATAFAIHMGMDTRLRTGEVTYHPGLPISIFSTGLAMYLLGTAVRARTDRPGRTMLLALLVMSSLAMLGEPLTRNLITTDTLTEYVAGVEHASAPGWVRKTLLALVLGGGAVWVSGLLGRHGAALAGVRRRWMRTARPTRALPRATARAAAPGPRRVATGASAVLRQFLALRSRLGWSALIVVGVCAPLFLRFPAAGSSEVEGAVSITASLWPALVWLDERSRRRDWDESVPVGRLPLRLAHALAGAVWLMIAILPATLMHPAGIAVPASALVLYLACTAGAALLGRPVLACFIAGIATSIASFKLAPEHPLSLAHALAPLDTPNGIPWSPAASLLWLTLLSAAAVAALHWQARRDRIGRTWFPRLRRSPQPA